MKKVIRDRGPRAQEAISMGLELHYAERFPLTLKGHVFFEMRDAKTGESLSHWEKDNIVTLDAGILMARLFADTLAPPHNPAQHVGVTMLAVGTGAAGNPLDPDPPTATQRRLGAELARKPVTYNFVDESGNAVAYPTHILDLSCTFDAAEAVGPWDEMALLATYSMNPLDTSHKIENGPGTAAPVYDPTWPSSTGPLLYDLLANYLTFKVINKPDGAIITIVWRLTF